MIIIGIAHVHMTYTRETPKYDKWALVISHPYWVTSQWILQDKKNTITLLIIIILRQ